MYPIKALSFLRIERECVSRECDRNCGGCDLAQEREDLLAAYDCAIQFIEDRTKRFVPKLEWHRNQRKWLYYCGNCGYGVSRIAGPEGSGGDYCSNCGRQIDWRIWLNEREYYERQEKRGRNQQQAVQYLFP